MTKKRIFITGVSSGLGYGLALNYLKAGEDVWGCSRRCPNDLVDLGLNFCALDLQSLNNCMSFGPPTITKLTFGNIFANSIIFKI